MLDVWAQPSIVVVGLQKVERGGPFLVPGSERTFVMQATDETDALRRKRGDRWRIVLTAFRNAVVGVLVGLVSYYLITDATTETRQRRLRRTAPETLFAEEVEPGPTLDFEGWTSQDRAYWRSLRNGETFGRIVAERMDLDAVVVKGVTRADLVNGPGWVTYTDLPGPTGNCGIAGHRVTHGAPFRWIDRLKTGDVIRLTSPYRRYTYRVVRSFTVTPDRTDVLDPTEKPTLTLIACHPPHSARLRIIVQAELVAVERLRERPSDKESP